jgi:hypothetical protein
MGEENAFKCSETNFHNSWNVCRLSYWQVRYGGYSGDLIPTSALDFLKKDGNSVLVDLRSQASFLLLLHLVTLELLIRFSSFAKSDISLHLVMLVSQLPAK